MTRSFVCTFIFLIVATVGNAAIENLDEMDARKSRRETNTYYTGASSGNSWARQPESLMYNDTRTGHEVWIMSNTPNRSNVYYTDISPANPWSADGARLGFFSTRPVAEFERYEGTAMEGVSGTLATPFTVKTDGTKLKAEHDSADRTWGSTGTSFFYWSPVVPNVYYTTGGRANGLSLDNNAIYKNIVSDSATTYAKLVQFPGSVSTRYDMKKVISPDGKYLLPKSSGSYFPVQVYPENQAQLLDSNGWAEDRGQTNQWAGGAGGIAGCRHDIYFPSPNFFVLLFSENDCSGIKTVMYKYSTTGSSADGGPLFDPLETSYTPFGSKEVEPLWTWEPTHVPWKLEPSNNKHSWGHPGFDRWGRIVIYNDGNGYWGTNGTSPLYEFGGPVAWDYKNRKLVAQPTETEFPQVLVEKDGSYIDFNAWSDFFAYSKNGSSEDDSERWILTAEYNKTNDAGNDWRYVAYHYQNKNNSSNYQWTSNNRIAQSPDGTKISYAVTFLTNTPDTGDLAYAVAYYPHPPEITSVTGSGTYTIRFDWRLGTTPRGYTTRGWPNESTNNPPPPRETKSFRLWRSANGTSGWTPVSTVDAEIFTRYNFSTGVWSGDDYWTVTDTPGAGTWYYAVTAIEHSGLESRTLSNVFSTAGSQTANYPADPKGATSFAASYNPDLARHYNIYAKDGSAPSISQTTRIASVPVAAGTSYVDWLGDSGGTTQYKVTAVDTQGNESSALTVTSSMRGTAGQYDISWTAQGASCDQYHFDLCTTQQTCTYATGHWCAGACQSGYCGSAAMATGTGTLSTGTATMQ